MARLKVKLRGKTVNDVPLSEEKSYTVGRKEDCDIVLQPEKGISREHFKISGQNGQWTLELVSKYGDVLINGEKIQDTALEHGQIFSVPPYEFEFLMTPEAPAVAEGGHEVVATDEAGSPAVGDVGEKTYVGPAASMPFIKVVDGEGNPRELFKLDGGDTWIAGRETTCHIPIRDPRVSRRQFEIRKLDNGYYILDLESVNGTLLNGNPVSSTEPEPLRSGDSISVLTNHLFFELHDPHFRSRMELVSLQPMNPVSPVGQYSSDLVAYQQQQQVPIVAPAPPPRALTPMERLKQFDYKKNRKALIAGAAVFLLLVYFLAGDDKPVNAPAPVVQDAFSKLKPEQQSFVKQSYQLAKNLYMQGKYELAQNEINKIQEIIPDYEDLKDIQRLAREAIYIQDQKRRQEEIEKAKAEAEEKIQKQTEICKKKITPEYTIAELDECLSPVLQFNPEHPKFQELRATVDAIVAKREMKQAERAAYLDQVGRLKALFRKAQALEKEGNKNPEAIKAYEVVINSKLPDPEGLRKQSITNLENVRKMMNSKTAVLQADSDKAYQGGNLKGAILALRKARQIDPTNTELPDRIDRYVLELKKQMMVIYQEGILEESFGNVEGNESKAGAKEKWKRIIDQDIPDGEYYKKAYIKLKKYGNY